MITRPSIASRVLLPVLLLFLIVASPAMAEPVHCYDASRNALSYVGRDTCRHEIISAERARKIRDARRAYIRRSMTHPDPIPATTIVRSYGSGFFVHPLGFAITNHHVVARCGGISVLDHNGREAPAALIASSAREDLALLKVQVKPPAYAPISKANLGHGELITIMGFPVLKLPRREPMVMRGQFLGDRPVSAGGTVMTIDAQVWQGSSGSPAFNRYGQVVGVVFAKANIPGIYDQSGIVAEDRTYAIPARVLTAFLKRNNVKPVTEKPGKKSVKSERTLLRINCLR